MRSRGFTLLEVMVAVAILGLALTAILSAQAGLFSAGSHAQKEAQAIGLVRCKMGEIEERMLKYGYPEVETNDEGVCCQDSSNATDGYVCSWKIQRVELPQPPTFSDTNSSDAGAALSLLTSGLDGGLGSMPGSPGAMAAYGGGAAPPLPNGLGAFGPLLGAAQMDGGLTQALGGADGGIGGLASMMGGATTTGVAGLAPLVMSIVYPSLKPMLEASIRKVVLTIKWREGLVARDMTLIQYLTNPMRGGFMGDPMASGMPGLPGMPGGGTTPLGPSTGALTGTPMPTMGPNLGGFR